jgi:UMF1 family MFS transporter
MENRKEIFGWAMFDFANSSYTTIVVTVIFNVYFATRVVADPGQGDFLWSVGVATSQLVIVVTAPFLGALADFSGAKKKFLFVSYLICVLGTAGLGLVTPGAVTLALVLFIISNAAFSASENFVSAFLPEIAPREMIGRVSAYGWSLGYFGGLACLGLCLVLLWARGGLDRAPPNDWYRLTCLLTAGFFALAAVPTFLWVKERKAPEALPPGQTYLTVGFSRLRETFREIRRYGDLFKFLCAFFFIGCGLWTVVAFSGIYATQTLKLTQAQTLIFFVIVQVTAAVGAFVFGQIQDRIGSVVTIQITLLIWLAVILGAYLSQGITGLYLVGNLAGVALGATQSAGRALVGLFSPLDKEGEFFGFWGLSYKLAAVLGLPVFGIISSWTGSQRLAILVTGLFFVVGGLLMFTVNEKRGIRSATADSSDPTSP